jgi:8-amino-7-oxononanoate synthase
MVDEAHGVGVLGAKGTGACELFGVEDEVDLRMGTFSKSLASCGGFIAGSAEVIDYLRISARAFLFTAAAVPAAVAAALEAVRICRSPEGAELFARVLDNARYLHAGLRDLGYRVVEPTSLPGGGEVITPIVPVVIGDDLPTAQLWKTLWDEGVYTNVALHPAVPPGRSLIRTSVMATHGREHLDQALVVFERIRHTLPAA